jgi:hypothetical protein
MPIDDGSRQLHASIDRMAGQLEILVQTMSLMEHRVTLTENKLDRLLEALENTGHRK